MGRCIGAGAGRLQSFNFGRAQGWASIGGGDPALCRRCQSKESIMDLPRISLDQIPGLDDAQALFGSVLQAGGPIDDRIVDIMVFLYEVLPPAPTL